jgi:hypothetical protein
MSRPIEAITNVETGETVYQEMSDESYAIYLADKAADEIAANKKAIADAANEAAKEAATAKLTALGLTTDDLKALGLGTN